MVRLIIISLFSFLSISNYSINEIPTKINKYTDPIPSEDQSGDITVLTLNTWGLPIPYPKSNKKYRYPKLISMLKSSKADVICLQEVFDKKLRKIIKDSLSSSYYISSLNCNRKVYGLLEMDCEGGLLVLSKFPIVSHKFVMFPLKEGMKLEEKIGRKGFSFSEISTNSGIITFINTHLYSGKSQSDRIERVEQFTYLTKELEYYKNNNPLFILGDLNIQCPESSMKNTEDSIIYNYLSKNFSLSRINPSSKFQYSFDPSVNTYVDNKKPKQKLDYIFYKNIELNDICIAHINTQILVNADQVVSDHLAIKSKFKFNSSMENSIIVTLNDNVKYSGAKLINQ
jgi:endonuclease/exonuclease/phosphatase family metal-dependent hydrolase